MRIVGLEIPEKEAQQFVCGYCDKGYASKSALEKHIESKHAQELGEEQGDE